MPRRLIIALLALIPMLAPRAAEIHVGSGHPQSTLRAAIAAAQSGDTIVVHPGTYRDSRLLIDKPLTIIGRDNPVLDGLRDREIFTITASHVTIRGFELRNAGESSFDDIAGIHVTNATHVLIENNRILDCSFGIFFAKSKDVAARHNEIVGSLSRDTSNGNGIHAWSCDRVELSDNTIRDHRDGIYIEFVNDSLIDRNLVTGCLRYGLHFMTAHRNAYRENTFLHNGAGVAVMYSRQVVMEANRFGHSWGSASYGLLLKEINDSRIVGNIFESNSTAVTIQSSTRTAFERNVFRDNGWALQIQASSTDNTYTANNFFGNSFDLTSRGELTLNHFEGNYWDKAETYDLNRDGVSDVPHRPLSLFAMLVDRIPASLLLLRSPLVHFLDRAERIFPSLTPDRLLDPKPAMHPLSL